MLESTQRFDLDSDAKDHYNLELPYDQEWKHSKRRVLVVMQTVPALDLSEGVLCGSRMTNTTFKNCVKHTKSIVRAYEGNPEAAFALVNFNAYRHLHLPSAQQRSAETEFAARVHKVIRKLKPTHVLVSGDQAMHALFPDIEYHGFKRGWVHTRKITDDLTVKVTSTIDFSRCLEKKGALANLLGFWCRHLGNLLLGKNPHDLSHVKAKPKYIKTIEEFDQLMTLLAKSEEIGVDTETANLSVLHNKIYTIQFASNLKPDTGYVLVLRHPMTHWSKDELEYIRKRLKKFFEWKKQKTLLFFNGIFDLRVIRRDLKIPIIWHKAWEIMAGEHLLDENAAMLPKMGFKTGGLAPTFCSYGNDFYYTAAFSKEERATIGSIKPTNPDFLAYAANDVVSLLHMKAQQILKASKQRIGEKNYKEYFIRHMLYQMSDTVHSLSHLKEDGSFIDRQYLKFLISNDSPLIQEMKSVEEALKKTPEYKKANQRILGNAGHKSKGLFGSLVQTWALKLSKQSHLRVLFFDIMGLEPTSQTASGEDSVNKQFISAYKFKNRIAEMYSQYSVVSKLLGTYAKGWFKILTSNKDAITDGHLRPEYSFWDVATGRLATRNPSLQTIPTRSKLAKIIKRMFIAPEGTLLLRFDYSAHEVRVWSYVSGDKILADVFRVGQKLRQKWIVDPSEENKKAIKEKGDVHIQNVLRFFKKLVEKSHPLRDAVKAVVFGVLYGKSAETLGEDTKTAEINALKDKIAALYKEKAELVNSK